MNGVSLKAKQVKKSFRESCSTLLILRGITVCFDQGSTYAITGVSGTGKSTLLQILAGFEQADAGVVYYSGNDISLYSYKERDWFHNTQIGLIFQSPYLIRELSVLENIMLPGLIGGENKKVCYERALQLLGCVGLDQRINSNPYSLSGGQQQRVALARALFNKPTFLLADEPTGNLDESTGHLIIDLLLSCQSEWRMGLIVSSHDVYVARKMQYVYQLKDGFLCKC